MEKTYIANVKGNITEDKIEHLRNGVDIGDYVTREAKVEKLDEENISITIHEGKNRQVRRMCDAVGIKVLKLKRTNYGPLSLGELPVAKYRHLTDFELYNLNK